MQTGLPQLSLGLVSNVILRSEATKNLGVGLLISHHPQTLRYAQGDMERLAFDTKPPCREKNLGVGAFAMYLVLTSYTLPCIILSDGQAI